MVELWESEQALAAWRAAAKPPPKPEILEATVLKHQISSSGPAFWPEPRPPHGNDRR
jgi:hypothetical protein